VATANQVNTALPVATTPANTAIVAIPAPVTTIPATRAQEKQEPTMFEKIVAALSLSAPSNTAQQAAKKVPQEQSSSSTAPLATPTDQLTQKNDNKKESTLPLKKKSATVHQKKSTSKTNMPKKLKDTPSTLVTPSFSPAKKPSHLIHKNTTFSPLTIQAHTNAQTIKNTQKLHTTYSAKISPSQPKTQTRKTLSNTVPRTTRERPSTKKIQPKNKKQSCTTSAHTFEIYPPIKDLPQPQSAATFYTYPALDDTLQSLPAAPVFYTYPALDDSSQPCSTKTFEIYPVLQDRTQPTQSLKIHSTPSLPIVKKTPTTELAVQTTEPLVQETSTALSETSPVQGFATQQVATQQVVAQPTQLIVQATPQEQLMPLTAPTNWADRTKKLYEKSVTYFKELFSPKSSTAPLSNAVLHSQNAAMEVHSVDTVDGSNDKDVSGNFTLQPEVMRSFRPHALTRALFGCDLYNDTTLHIRGSALARNDAKDWLADYFYLSNNYEGIVCFTPRVTSFLTDLSLFIDLNSWFNGCFLRVESPLTWTKWDLGMREQIINSGNVNGAQGWRGDWTSVDNKLLSSFTDYSCWEKAGTSYVDSVGLAHPLYAAKLCPCGRAKTELADLHVDFGMHAHEGERYHVGLYARGVMPTGTKPDGEFLFEPIVGNGHFWELGGGVNGYAQLWKATDKSQEVGLYLDGSITHLFSSHQQRIFDLKNHGLMSRYMLVTNSATAPSSITPAANITSAHVNVSVPMQIDLIALVNYANDVFSWNCGYNFWSRSCEKIDCCDIMTNNVCDNCSAGSGLDGITWMPYTDSTIKELGTSSLATALSQDDLDLNSSRTKGSSHKIFTSLNYSWINIDDVVVPFLGIGAELELGKSESATANACCTRVSLSQWGLWLRMGTEF
jgi:hypothetical protein